MIFMTYKLFLAGDFLGTTDTRKRVKIPKDIKGIKLNMLIYQGF